MEEETILLDDYNEERERKKQKDVIEKLWRDEDREDLKSVYCETCFYWDFKNYKESSNRENYCTMNLIGERDEYQDTVVLGKIRKIKSGKILEFVCKKCTARKSMSIDNEEEAKNDK